MTNWNRRVFMRAAGFAIAGGAVGLEPGGFGAWAAQQPAVPDEILNPVEVTGEEAVPIIGRLPGARRMYMLPANQGEYHLVGSQVMTRVARPAETGNVHELMTFAGTAGAAMPRHLHRGSHAALLVLSGEIEVEVEDRRWRMLRGDFANLPPGIAHAWTMRSDRAQLALFTMGDRAGAAFTAMGLPHQDATPPSGVDHVIAAGKLANAADQGDFLIVPVAAPAGQAVRVSNLVLPLTPGPYVLLDGGGERFGGNTFLAKNANSNGQFLFIITEGGPGPGVPAHFHARHFENFFALDGETLGWAYGKALPLKTGDYFQAPPRNLHGFRLTQSYNRFAAFLTPGIFESFFTRGGPGQNGVGGRGGAGAPGQTGRDGGPPNPGRGGPAGGRRGGGANDMFRTLMMSGRGPDGYPLDVHGPTLPLPPQDPVWLQGPGGDAVVQRAALLAHAQAVCGIALSREITPALRRAMTLKPRAEDFI